MPAEAQSNADATAPFGSLFELRRAHSELMRSVGDRAHISELTQRIRDFLARAAATGAVLRASDEREAAQNILDYWNASLLTMRGVDRSSFTTTQLEPVDESLAPDLSNKPNPYTGLSAFDEKSADQFYGREEAVRILLEKIKRHPIVFIIGPIGSGKSSLVMAGLLPLLAASTGREETAWAILPTVIPGTEPLEALLRALYRSGRRGDRLDFAQWIAEQKSRLKREPDAICDLIDLPTGNRSAILVVDQFEEVFTQCRNPAERDAFVAALVALTQTTNVQFKIVLIIREDMAEQSLQLAPIRPFAQDLDTRLSPPPPTRGELLQMITLPAKAVGLEFDEGIVDELCKEVLGEVTALPLLQFTLSQLWAAREGNRVTWAVYRQVGRPREALRHTTEQVYSSLSPEDQAVALTHFAHGSARLRLAPMATTRSAWAPSSRATSRAKPPVTPIENGLWSNMPRASSVVASRAPDCSANSSTSLAAPERIAPRPARMIGHFACASLSASCSICRGSGGVGSVAGRTVDEG